MKGSNRGWLRRLRARLGRSERGNAIVEFSYLVVLALVPLVYIMLGVFNVQRAMYATSAAARDAGRAYTLAGSVEEANAAANQAARLSFEDQQLDFSPGDNLHISCDPGCLQPGSVAIANVTYDVPLPFSGFLKQNAPSIHVETTHRTPYGQYRQAGG